MLSAQSKNPWRSAPHWKCAVRRDGQGPKALSERATGMLEEVVKAKDHVKADCRRAVFGRRVLTFRLQGWYLGAAKNLREISAPSLSPEPNAVERWPSEPFEGAWPFPLPSKGRKVVIEWSETVAGLALEPGLSRLSLPCGFCHPRRHSVGVPLADVGQPVAQLDVARHPQFGRGAFPV